MKRLLSPFVAVAALSAPTAALAQETFSLAGGAALVRSDPAPVAVAAPAPLPEPDTVAAAPSSRPEISIGAGMRASLIKSSGFDPYASSDLLMQGSVALGVTVLRAGRASILLSAEWDGGARSGSARGLDASLALHRLAGVAETRVSLHRRFFLGAKLAPAAFYLAGTINDTSLSRPLSAHKWTWGLDTSGEAGVLLGSTGARGVKFWLTLDLGYTFAGEAQMAYAPGDDSNDPRKFGTVMLPALRPSGPSSRLALALAF